MYEEKLIALLLATATIVSACGAEAKESDEEDVENIDEEESSKSDEAEEDDDDDEGDGNGLFGLGDGAATTDTNEPAAAETQTVGDMQAVSNGQPTTVTYIDDASVTVEQSDVNANLWVITNTSTTTYHIQPKESSNGDMIVDSSFAPGEVLYYFAASDDGEITKDSFKFSTDDAYEMGSEFDTQCAVVTASFDDSKCNDYGDTTMYALDDVWEAYKEKMIYEDVESRQYDARVVYFRLYDADGNVIYEPASADEFSEWMGMYCAFLVEGIYWDPSVITNWDHAEFYVKAQY